MLSELGRVKDGGGKEKSGDVDMKEEEGEEFVEVVEMVEEEVEE